MSQFARSFGMAMRRLWRDKSVTTIVVLTLALGIGANIAIFGLLNALLLQPLAVQRPDALTVLAWQRPESVSLGFSYPELTDLREASRGVARIVGSRLGSATVRLEHQTTRAAVSAVSSDYFVVLGLTPAAGQFFASAAGGRALGPVVVLSHAYWTRTFGADPRVIGTSILVNRAAATVVAVGPPDFSGDRIFANVDLFVPLEMVDIFGNDPTIANDRAATPLRLLGVIDRDSSLEAFNGTLAALGASLMTHRRGIADDRVVLQAFPERMARPNPRAARAELVGAAFFAVLTGLVLLLACTNVTTLMLARLIERRPEFALHMVLGATPARIATQLLAETLILSGLAGVAGIVGGQWVGIAISRLLPSSLAGFASRMQFQLDWRLVAFTIGIVLFTTIVAGLIPAFRAAATRPGELLPSAGLVPSRERLRAILIAAQIAAAVVIIIVAGLFTRSLAQTRGSDFGFDPLHVSHVTVNTAELGYTDIQSRTLLRTWLEDVQRLPEVESATLAAGLPMSSSLATTPVFPEQCAAAGKTGGIDGNYTTVGSNYFDTLKVRRIAGRDFTGGDREGTALVAVVNRTFAETCWSDANAVGRRFRLGSTDGRSIAIVGVVDDAKEISAIQGKIPFFYLPLNQHHRATQTLLFRSPRASAGLLPIIERKARDLAPDIRPFAAGRLVDTIDDAPDGLYLFRVAGTFAWSLGMLGLALALVGAYAVTSQWVRHRTWEMAVHMALGADRADIRNLVLKRSGRLIGSGIVIGVTVALIGTRLVAFLFFGVSPWDPVTYLTAVAVIVTASLLASYLPARRVMQSEPALLLKSR
jgi:predicted permease